MVCGVSLVSFGPACAGSVGGMPDAGQCEQCGFFTRCEPAGGGDGGWGWVALPVPPLGSLPPYGLRWERDRYRAYQAWLAGHAVAEVAGRAAAFVELAYARAVPAAQEAGRRR